MFQKPKCAVIALEEHYWDAELAAQFPGGVEASRETNLLQRLYDLGDLRIKEMDEAGIDIQVLSHGAPSAQKLSGDIAVALTRRVNDRLHETVRAHPTRFAGFAALPTSDPAAAADELERTVGLGFKGAMIHGLANGIFLDDKRFWPIWERAQALDVPIYLHPSVPHSAVADIYYNDYVADFPQVVRAAWGFTVETATVALRLVLGGVFEAFPRLKIILGHLGETLPYMVWRIDAALSRPGHKQVSFRNIFCGNFYITTSGNFSTPALVCCVAEMGIDRVLFAVDWPFVANLPAVRWMKDVPFSNAEKAKILSGNSKRLLRM
jgi:2,3-dihydroxybenzoate decarboxylase